MVCETIKEKIVKHSLELKKNNKSLTISTFKNKLKGILIREYNILVKDDSLLQIGWIIFTSEKDNRTAIQKRVENKLIKLILKNKYSTRDYSRCDISGIVFSELEDKYNINVFDHYDQNGLEYLSDLSHDLYIVKTCQ